LKSRQVYAKPKRSFSFNLLLMLNEVKHVCGCTVVDLKL
jgi:hypothetical protein